MSKLSSWRTMFCLWVFCASAAISSPAQTFTTLVNFDFTDGAFPQREALIQGADGDLYGTTFNGGANTHGTVFKITPGGTLTSLYSFCSQTGCSDGANPVAGLVLATDGNFYGMTYFGGIMGNCTGYDCGSGTVFKIAPGGTLDTLHRFDGTDGSQPSWGLVQASNGNFYGTTNSGGVSSNCTEDGGCGTVFELTVGGTLTTLYSFCSQTGCTDGWSPYGSLVQAGDGNFYGTTVFGGTYNSGTVFKITPGGELTTLYSFCAQTGCTDGSNPLGGLVQATDGKFYGATEFNGANGDGTIFKITPEGELTTLYSFCANMGCTDGSGPNGGLVQATDGNFYGTTLGLIGDGTVFKMSAAGTLTTLHTFDGTDGFSPEGGLVQATNGTFYGTTLLGGSGISGTIFSLSVGLGPFVETVPTSGAVGAIVNILGNNLTSATTVTFNGTATAFTLVSSSEIITTVPAGATTGIVQVTTPSGTLSSNVAFQVTNLEITPEEQIAILQDTVEALVSAGIINTRVGQLLLASLNAALRTLDAGRATEAIRLLEGFISEVRRLVILGRLTPAEGNILIDAANSIITAIRG